MNRSPLSIFVLEDHHQSLPRGVVLTPVRTPAGVVIGQIVLEGEDRVFVRRVRASDRYRALDSWTIGEAILRQLIKWRVTRIRYLAPEGRYESTLAFFRANAVLLDCDHELQHTLPRGQWPTGADTAAPMPVAVTGAAQVDLFEGEVTS
jgi:hypothetical protein